MIEQKIKNKNNQFNGHSPWLDWILLKHKEKICKHNKLDSPVFEVNACNFSKKSSYAHKI